MLNNDLELCRDPLIIEGEVILGIHSNVIGSKNAYTAGHAWITIQQDDNKIFYLGLWPDGHPRVSNNKEECTDTRIGLEAGSMTAISRYYKLNQGQLSALNRVINTPQMWRYTYNCSNWANDVLKNVIGVHINIMDYIIFSTPRELGAQLHKFEKKQPTSPKIPVVGRPVEAAPSTLR